MADHDDAVAARIQAKGQLAVLREARGAIAENLTEYLSGLNAPESARTCLSQLANIDGRISDLEDWLSTAGPGPALAPPTAVTAAAA